MHRYKCRGARRADAAAQVAELVSWLETGPDPDVDGVVRRRRQDLRARVSARFGVDLHERTVGKYLAALGYRLSVRPRHPKTDPATWMRRGRPRAGR